MNQKVAIVLVFLVIHLSPKQAAKILGIFAYPARSHFTCGNAVLRSLIQAKHEVTIITSFPKEAAKENYTAIIDVSEGQFIYFSQSGVDDLAKYSLKDLFHGVTEIEIGLCEKIINLDEIKNIIKSKKKKFDAMIVGVYLVQHCFYWLGYKLGIPVIGVSTFRSWPLADMEISNPRNWATISMEYGTFSNLKNFNNRLKNLLETSQFFYYWYTITRNALTDFYQRHAKDELSLAEFTTIKPSLMFTNSHCSYFPRPKNPNFIEIGGIHLTQNESLSEDIQTFLNDATQGTILFTFGSIVRMAKEPKNKIQAFLDAFSEIPQKVIWKYEDELENIPNNVMISDWLPQRDILAHRNVKAFISHCGQGAIHESLYYGVPLIAVPLLFDQRVNCGIFVDLEIGVSLDYDSITKENILQALNEIINNTKYYEKMQTYSHTFKDRPMTPHQTVVYWTEYVIRHKGAPHLVSSASNLKWYQYLLLDVILFVVTVSVIILWVAYRLLQSLKFVVLYYYKKILKNKQE